MQCRTGSLNEVLKSFLYCATEEENAKEFTQQITCMGNENS